MANKTYQTTRQVDACTRQGVGTVNPYRWHRRQLLLSSASPIAPALLPNDVFTAVQREADLWQQELQLYRRKLTEQVQSFFQLEGSTVPALVSHAIDPQLSHALLELPIHVMQQGDIIPGWEQQQYAQQAELLKQRSRPLVDCTCRTRNACGHCGTEEDANAALGDSLWVDFLSYVQFKTIARQIRAAYGNSQDQSQAVDALHSGLGQAMLTHIRNTSPDQRQALENTSPTLPSIRAGVNALLLYFQQTGYVTQTNIAFFGASRNEERNMESWERGDAAYLKYWIKEESLKRSGEALMAEEGFQQEFVAASLFAYLQQCGVTASGMKRMLSYSSPEFVSQQWTLRRIAPLPDTPDDNTLQYKPFLLDSCPNTTGSGCY